MQCTAGNINACGKVKVIAVIGCIYVKATVTTAGNLASIVNIILSNVALRTAGGNACTVNDYVCSVVNGVVQPGAAAANNCRAYRIGFKVNIHTVNSLCVKAACRVPRTADNNIRIGSIIVVNFSSIRADIGNSAAIAIYIIINISITISIGSKIIDVTICAAALNINFSLKVTCSITYISTCCKSTSCTYTAGISCLYNRIFSLKFNIAVFTVGRSFISIISICRYANSCICSKVCAVAFNGISTAYTKRIHINAFYNVRISSKISILCSKSIAVANIYSSNHTVIFAACVNHSCTYSTCRK